MSERSNSTEDSREFKHAISWGHININVTDLDQAIAFYRKLGFVPYLPGIPYVALNEGTAMQSATPSAAVALGLPDGTTGRACIMQLADGGYPKIDLCEFQASESGDVRTPLESRDTGIVRICLLCTDLMEIYRDLSSDGVEFLTPPTKGEKDMVTIATCRDPDGSLIELLEVHRDKWRENNTTE